MTKAIMIQGAGSNVGKSMIVAGLVRAFKNRGLSVAPFKPQNMSNNAAVTQDGGEIGRAQALQALAAGRAPHTDMNPVLLKPESETGAQIVVQGRRIATLKARDYGKMKSTLMPKVLESYQRLAEGVDLIIIEGAGSPAEINLRAGDIANMGFAEAANCPVILTGDIDRGGVIAQLVGTHHILPQQDQSRIKGFIVNKFRGDPTLFTEGADAISQHAGWADLGILPWFADAWKLPAEDVMDISSRPGGAVKIAVPRLSRIANFDDLDPLVSEPGVTIDIIEPGRPLPGDAHLVIIPGSKSTIADLADFRHQGWDVDLRAHLRRGGNVMGICGGYQMLGKKIYDPMGIEGKIPEAIGLGLLDVETTMTPKKHLTERAALCASTGTALRGYEIHIGETSGPDCDRPMLILDGEPAGASNTSGSIRGCYLHGLFTSDAYRREFLNRLGAPDSGLSYSESLEQTLDNLADHLEQHLDLDHVFKLAEVVPAL